LHDKVKWFTIVTSLLTSMGSNVGRKPKSASEKAEEKRHLERLGKHLKVLREAKNLTPQHLADKLGVTPQYIYMIESGRAKPSEKRLSDLARALGDSADEFLATAVTHVEDEFAARLRQAGLSSEEIEEAAGRVSARAKGDVVSGNEPLRISRDPVPEDELFGALAGGEEILAIDSLTFGEQDSASSYAKSVKESFGSKPAAQDPPKFLRTPAAGSAGTKVKAGPDAEIVVNRSVTRAEKKALKDIGKVIAHLLKR